MRQALATHRRGRHNPLAEDQIESVSRAARIGLRRQTHAVVFNKIDRVTDRSYLDVLLKKHRHGVAISAASGVGLSDLRQHVVQALKGDFADAEVRTHAGNGRVIAYLSAHAEIQRQEYQDDQVVIHCMLPRHLLHHIEGPTVSVRFL